MKNIVERRAYDVKDVDLKAIGKYLKSLRVNNGVKVSELQDYFGFTNPQTIYNWESGKKLCNISNLLAIADLYQVSIDDILYAGTAPDYIA